MIRSTVPEFEHFFQKELAAEGGELGVFQATSAFAEWVRARLDGTVDDAGEDEVIRRAFAAVERLVTDESFPLGNELATEFLEGIWDHPAAYARMGPATRVRVQAM